MFETVHKYGKVEIRLFLGRKQLQNVATRYKYLI